MDDIIGNSSSTSNNTNINTDKPLSSSTSSTSSSSSSSSQSPLSTSSIKKELSPFSEPYIPHSILNSSGGNYPTIPQPSTTTPPSPLLKSSTTSSHNLDNQPQQPQQQQQQQNATKREKITLENVEYLFSNRFHPKNNIREAIVSTFNSIIYTVAEGEGDQEDKDKEKHQGLSSPLPPPTSTSSSSTSLPSPSSSSSTLSASSSDDLNTIINDIITIIDHENEYILKLCKDVINNNTNNNTSSSHNDIKIKSISSMVKIIKKNKTHNESSSPLVKIPKTLPFEDSESYYQRVILFNLHLLTKIATNIPSLCDRIQSHLFTLYETCKNIIIISSTSSATTTTTTTITTTSSTPSNSSSSSSIIVINIINNHIIPTLLICLSQMVTLVKFNGMNQDLLGQIIVNEMKQQPQPPLQYQQQQQQQSSGSYLSNRVSLEANLHLLQQLLSKQSINSIIIEGSPSLIKDIFRKLVSLVYLHSTSIQTRLPLIFQQLVTKQLLDVNHCRKVISIVLFKLTELKDDAVKQSYLDLLPKIVSYIDVNNQKNLNSKVNDISLPYKLLLMRSQGTNGQPFAEFFKRIFEWIYGTSSQNQSTSQLLPSKQEVAKNLLDQFYYFNIVNILSIENQRLDKKKVESIITSSSELIWYWAMWECARYCISNRLKTAFGSGVQTFEIFERIILQLIRERKDFNKIKLMLLFMDSLEKQIFSSAYGSVILPGPSSKEILFFKLNSRVSEDWFSRIRTNLLKSSILCSSAPDIIRHATLRINDIRVGRFVDPAHAHYELEFCIIHLANAFQQLGEADSLVGLSKWIDNYNQMITATNLANSTQSLSMSENIKREQSPQKQREQSQPQVLPLLSTPWIHGTIQSSKQRFEESISSLTPLISTTNPNSLSFPFIIEHVIKSYIELSDFQEMEQFILKYKDKIKESNVKMVYKDSYLKTLSSFAKGDLETSKSFVSECITDLNKEQQNGLIGNLLAVDDLILAIMILQKDSVVSGSGSQQQKIKEFIMKSKSLVQDSLGDIGFETNVQTFQYISQLKIIDELENGITTNTTIGQSSSPSYSSPALPSKSKQMVECSNQQPMIGYLERLRRIRNHISSTQHRSDILFYNIPLTEKLIQFSRKTSNYRFCHRLLNTILESHSPSCFLEKIKLKYHQDKKIEAFQDLLNSINHFPDNISPSIKTKSYLHVIKYLNANKNNQTFQSFLSTLSPIEQVDIESNFKKAVSTTPENVKMWSLYGDWAFEQSQHCNNDVEKTKYLNVATDNYFEYLKYNTDRSTIQTTLKIFNLLVNHGDQLQHDNFDRSIKSVSITPFFDIIPQMFARLGHCSKYSQSVIIDILNRIAIEDPNRIVFSTMVGHQIQQQLLQRQQQQQQQQSSSSQQSSSTTTSFENYNAQKDYSIGLVKKQLLEQCPTLVQETEVLIKGLENITILWDDSWHLLMEQIHLWICMHIKEWNFEYTNLKKAKTPNLNSKLKRKNLSLMQPVLDKIKKLLSTTVLLQCNTPHEKWFASTHYEIINKVVRCIEKQTKPSNPFVSLQELIQHFAINRLANLDLYSVSPQLYDFHPSQIAMPGLGQSHVKVQSILPTIYLLPTKTKPKKISFLGSDGMTYSYLLKGREDLHLDERVMQFQTIIDQLLITDKKSNSLCHLRTRSYAVVPLSQSSGIIQWVESAVPLFSIYKNWYRNEITYKNDPSNQSQQNKDQQNQSGQSSRVSVRPVDLFYNKLVPLLNERGISRVHRADWPKDVLVKVYNDLVNETPKWLLSRELWYSSCSTSELFLKIQSFSRSLALMSMVGYVIGLGDRHLDNILIDLKTGEVVHIDYNICFEKGLQLKVPEKVPFRMTQIIEHALGLTGVNGTFSETCIQVLGLLRKNKQTLLNILETFIYDPLYDWKFKQNEIITKENEGVDTNTGAEQQKGGKGANEEDDEDDSEGSSSSDEEESSTTGNTTFNMDNMDDTMENSDAKQEVGLPNKTSGTRSIQGLAIANQVRLKLEGTEQKLSVEKQVEMAIKEAKNIENLSSMYEGWTPFI